MNPVLFLHLAGIFLSYSLQVGIAYLACCLLNRLLRQPQHRFLLWMAFLLGAGVYWLGLIWSELPRFSSPAAVTGNIDAGATLLWSRSLLLPLVWRPDVVLAGQIIGLAYAAVVVILLGVAAWRHLQLRLVLRHAIKPSETLTALFDETCRDVKPPRSRLLVLPGLGSPATACWWNPRILLPEVCEQLGPTPQLAGVLYHELVHVGRRDYLWSALSDLICRILFFHPAVWQARKRLRLQSELACDMTVVETRPVDRADYADTLAYFVRMRMLREGISLVVDFAASASTLGMRIRTILATPRPLPWWNRMVRTAAALALVAAVAVLSPGLKVFLGFASPDSAEAAAQTQTKSAVIASSHASNHSGMRRAGSASTSAQTQNRDSLSTLRVQTRTRETPAYRLVAGGYNRPDAEPGELDRSGWNEPGQQPRTVSSILLTTVGQFPSARSPRGHDRDRDVH